MYFGWSIGKEGTECTLVQGGKDNSRNGQSKADSFDIILPVRFIEPFKEGRQYLGNLDGEVGRNMPGHKKEYCSDR